ncbi:SMI1/KNR4 family protein [Streptomyces sp. NPDC096132]|uniref:SMI1/KNR4 family protein n=1 Tax=Streptomyces sp. NPDC096132 TaxID=3366075 RepID=UPI00380E141B
MGRESLEQAWSSAERRLGVIAPASRAALRPPVEGPALEEWERQSGIELPEELTCLLALHDGAENTEAGSFLPSGTRLLPVVEAIRITRRMCDALDDEELVGQWWHPQWLAFAANHDGASVYFVDARPGAGRGSVGYFFRETGGACGKWPSLTAFFETLTSAVEDGERMHGESPRTKDDMLTWD